MNESRLNTSIRIVTWFCLAAAAWACVVYLRAMRPFVESVDFFHCVCYARDMIHHPRDVPQSGYRYFPGVYAFWRTALRLTGESLAGLQWTFLAVLATNAILVGCVVYRVCRTASGAVYSGIWYLVLCSRYEGFAAETEPMATIPFLAGILVWGGRSLKGRQGYVCSVVLGAGLGMALYFKQQAGLLSLGAAALLVNLLLAPRDRRHAIGPILVLPVAAMAVFLAAIAGEGKGLLPIEVGLSQVSAYQTESSPWRNVYSQIRNDESASLAAGLVVLGWLGVLAFRRGRRMVGEPWLEVVGYLVVSGLATLAQYRWRVYYHYALLAIPGLVIAAVVLGVSLYRRLPKAMRLNALVQFALLGCAAFPLLYTGGSTSNLRVWRVWLEPEFSPYEIWRKRPDIAADLDELRKWVEPGDELLVLPIRRNSIHWVLGSRVVHYPNGYYWDPQPRALLETLESGQIASVLVVQRHDAAGDEENWNAFHTDEAVSRLPSLGFHPILELKTMALWRHEPR